MVRQFVSSLGLGFFFQVRGTCGEYGAWGAGCLLGVSGVARNQLISLRVL